MTLDDNLDDVSPRRRVCVLWVAMLVGSAQVVIFNHVGALLTVFGQVPLINQSILSYFLK